MAREQFREAKLAIVDEATTRDGRPDWRAAAWALEKAFPEDYGKPAMAERPLDRLKAFGPGAGAAGPGWSGPAETRRLSREVVGGMIEENEQRREVWP
jgi:hypothetical protein